MNSEVLVINYHRIETGKDTRTSRAEELFSVREACFLQQIEFLKGSDIPFISLQHLSKNDISAGLSIAVTIDDGNSSDYDIVAPVLRKLQIPATFFFVVSSLNQRGKISWSQAREMAGEGFSIGSHGYSHRDLTTLDMHDQRYELEYSKKCLEDKTGRAVNYFSFPFGLYNRKLIEIGKEAAYRGMLTTDFMLNKPDGTHFLIHRWSVRRNVSLAAFREILTSKNVLKKKMFISRIKRMNRQILGNQISSQLDVLFNSR